MRLMQHVMLLLQQWGHIALEGVDRQALRIVCLLHKQAMHKQAMS